MLKPTIKRKRVLLRLLSKENLYRRRFLIPNAVTLGNMFCGFLACIYSAQSRFEHAAIAIGIALLLDGLDGRVARKLNAITKFGLEFDSFSDVISFGVAPALLVYHWCFKPLADEFGVFVCFIFVLCAVSRLARFNLSIENLKNFVGLPTPGAAGMVAACVHLAPTTEPSMTLVGGGTVTMLTLSYLMISKIEFFSVKLLTVGKIRVIARLCLGALIAFTWYNSRFGFLLLASIYCISGPVKALQQKRLKKKTTSQVESLSDETLLKR